MASAHFSLSQLPPVTPFDNVELTTTRPSADAQRPSPAQTGWVEGQQVWESAQQVLPSSQNPPFAHSTILCVDAVTTAAATSSSNTARIDSGILCGGKTNSF